MKIWTSQKSWVIVLFIITYLIGCSADKVQKPVISGKIVSAQVANDTFGVRLSALDIDTMVVRTWLKSCENTIMFTILDNKLVVASDHRSPLYPSGVKIEPVTVLHKYSVTKVAELLDSGKAPVVSFELRKDVFSLTCGEYTLEWGTLCPPYCD